MDKNNETAVAEVALPKVPNVARAFGTLGKPLDNVMMVAVKPIHGSSHKLVSRAWRVLVSTEDGFFTHWFNTNRPFEKRELSDATIGAKVNLMRQRKATSVDDWEDSAVGNDYNIVDDYEYWPVQCRPHPDIVDCSDWDAADDAVDYVGLEDQKKEEAA